MSEVHLFISIGRFHSFRHMREFIDPTYTDDGDMVPSAFMREVGIVESEPGCIEAIHRQPAAPLAVLLAEASHADQWLAQVEGDRLADAAICVFPPNEMHHPQRCSLEYVGAFHFEMSKS